MGDSAKKISNNSHQKSRAAEIANTFEWLITAFVLAFVFRAFVMEAYRIPTGSMADTLMGAHFRMRCSQCGYRYEYGFDPERYRLPQDTIPRGNLQPVNSRCPSCGFYQLTGGTIPISNGDRILVLKCLYQFMEPLRWDVIVFKNPLDPTINYIKRLIGKPGEIIEIIDGDIYVNGQICRKPQKVQNELWMPVYDNDYQPVNPDKSLFNGHTWQQPFKNLTQSTWIFDKLNPTIFRLDSPPDQINSLIYDTTAGNDFHATYAYNEPERGINRPYCSDLMAHFYVNPTLRQGCIGISLSKYQTIYNARINLAGEMIIEAVKDGETVELARKAIELPTTDKANLVKFANVDHQLIFQFGTEKLTHDLGRSPEDTGQRNPQIEPEVKIFGSGKLAISHIAIFRDIHYTANNGASRAAEGNPLTLGKDEFFVLGDNSPNSADGRWWDQPGRGNNGRYYRKGIVPREYLVGKALFVYWPGGFRPFTNSRFAIVPNIGRMRLIYGGSGEKTTGGLTRM